MRRLFGLNLKNVVFSLAISGLFLSAAGLQADGPLPNIHVLAVGVDTYKDPRNNLKGCVNDAKNLAQRMMDQEGKVFGRVEKEFLLDGRATAQEIKAGMARLRNHGKAGDFVVLILSGHGNRDNGRFYFLAHDQNRVYDHEILQLADELAEQGKKVWIIVDACHAGQLRLNGREILIRHQNPQGGGIILMVSSAPSQTSAPLVQYSAFAQAVNEGLLGDADINGDHAVTMGEIRRFAWHRTHQLVRLGGHKEQDGECDWSPSFPEDYRLTVAKKKTVLRTEGKLTTADAKDRSRKDSFAKVYTVNLQQGVTYTINLESRVFDSFLRLESASGQELRRDDDGGGDRNARIVFTAPSTETYRLIVTSYQGGVTGTFRLAVLQNN